MQFLDAIGLASFWEKIKNWVNINYLSLTGGTIRGSVSFLNEADGGKSIRIDPSNITNSKYGVNYLFASGKMIPIGEANGVAGLDSNGCVPLDQLGNLDTTVAEVVTALPTTNIKKHIYLIKDASGVTQNQYEEYIYTGNTSATYDASKWEKLGDFRATVDLANYYTKSQVDSIANGKSSTSHTHSVIINGITKTIAASGGAAVNLGTYLTSHQSLAEYAKKNEAVGIIEVQESANAVDFEYKDIKGSTLGYVTLEKASENVAGVMSSADRNKLNLFDTSKVTSSIDVAKLLTVDYKGITMKRDASRLTVVLNTLDKSSSSLDFTAASPNIAGLMSGADKTKLNGIASGATADSAIPISVIDALN